MPAKLGNTEASLYLGSTPVAAYLGAVQVYSAAARTLYWNNALDNNSWASLGNWWDDASHTDPAASLPTSIDSVVITGGGPSATGQTVVDFTIANSSSISGTLTVTGVATFNSNSVNNGTITGNAVFNDNAENSGTVNGNATFNDNATNPGTVTGTVTDNT
jgi:hypothetical protein